ncbi:hypothetical protein [Streptomyces sp. NPDC059009]|uniref:hypothetical protein n=1 Tax=Streptomyces sp. NPDC059009 TaxID=3346694 RepID=UPI0036C16E68
MRRFTTTAGLAAVLTLGLGAGVAGAAEEPPPPSPLDCVHRLAATPLSDIDQAVAMAADDLHTAVTAGKLNDFGLQRDLNKLDRELACFNQVQ